MRLYLIRVFHTVGISSTCSLSVTGENTSMSKQYVVPSDYLQETILPDLFVAVKQQFCCQNNHKQHSATLPTTSTSTTTDLQLPHKYLEITISVTANAPIGYNLRGLEVSISSDGYSLLLTQTISSDILKCSEDISNNSCDRTQNNKSKNSSSNVPPYVNNLDLECKSALIPLLLPVSSDSRNPATSSDTFARNTAITIISARYKKNGTTIVIKCSI